ncbi:MAG TPA: hypothetical protein VFK59_13190 [Actinomycetota bacterium]|nr:hypothetical protein [Actinomycetota bacterium]
MRTAIAIRLLALTLAAPLFTAAGGPGEPAPTGVRVGSQIRVFGADREHLELARWAGGRFERAGMQPPAVDVHFHPDTAGCYGHIASTLDGRVDICVVIVSEIARDALLHEMGHVWIDEHVPDSLRQRFMEMRGLTAWSDPDVPWDDRAFEHGAEIIAWGLGHRYMAPSIPDREPVRLAPAFELLAGVAPPNPGPLTS